MPSDSSNFAGALVAGGLAGLVFGAALIAVGFVLSAWLGGLWLRLLFRMHRNWVNGEYARMHGRYVPTRADRAPGRGPRDW